MLKQDQDNLRSIRRDIVEVGFKCGETAHLGGAFSMVELLYVLYADFLRVSPSTVTNETRDIFILSKGHGALGFYSVLKHFGFISAAELGTFQSNGSKLIAHPVRNLEFGIESSNGSLGQGLSLLAGMALGSTMNSEDRRFVTILGDGECNEGSVWEAAMFCSQNRLSNVLAIVDNNGFQNDDAVSKVLDQNDASARWQSFGWNVIEIEGHCTRRIRDAYTRAFGYINGPTVIIANTVKGKGVSYMENNNEWHHNRLTEKTYLQALEDLNADD